jgi:hypothetical protein
VAYRNSKILAWNLKHHPNFELGALEVEFGSLPMGKLDWFGFGFGWMQNLILLNLKTKYLNLSLYAKVMIVLPKRIRVTVLQGGIWLGIEIG